MSQRVPLENRKKQVAEFLAEHGPATRSQILHAVGIPNGSLANVLLDKALFEQNASGAWQNTTAAWELVEKKKKETT